jgi:hypothetical protein
MCVAGYVPRSVRLSAEVREMASFNEDEVHAVVHRIHRAVKFNAPPFSTTAITDRLFPEVKVIAEPMHDHAYIEVYSRALPDGTKATIYYREQDHHSTQRFSIAHELGHYCFDHDFGRDVPTETATSCRHVDYPKIHKPKSEQRCDFFAASLLAPLWIVDDMVDFDIYPPKDDALAVAHRDQAIQRLASRFNVSRACMRRRVFDLAAWRRMARGR